MIFSFYNPLYFNFIVFYSYINYCEKTIVVEPCIDVLVFFTTDDGQHVGRNAFGLWPVKVFKSSWFLLYCSIQTTWYKEHPVSFKRFTKQCGNNSYLHMYE
jgi:hypothetical protein